MFDPYKPSLIDGIIGAFAETWIDRLVTWFIRPETESLSFQ